MSNDNKITLAKTWGHFKTITRHHHKVMCYCLRGGLIRQGIFHDLSKLSPTEFWVGARYFQGTRGPNNAERESTGVSTSWCHHKGRNKHHY
ncbi:MAG: catalase, partial [Lachnospiraceae bacterium]|nr:catalase [Candidatus Equihabitans merdae]